MLGLWDIVVSWAVACTVVAEVEARSSRVACVLRMRIRTRIRISIQAQSRNPCISGFRGSQSLRLTRGTGRADSVLSSSKYRYQIEMDSF
jgi:hypothetical protein